MFAHVCRLGLEGIVSKRVGRALSQQAIDGVAQVEEPGERGGAPRFARQLIADIDAELADLAREQAILKRHCTATPKEIQATAKAYKWELENAANAAVGRMSLWSLEKQLKKAKATVRRMRTG